MSNQQEPVAWMQDSIELYVKDFPDKSHTIPLYTSPPPRQPLTDEQIFEVHKKVDSMQYLTFARAIEAAHGINGEAT